MVRIREKIRLIAGSKDAWWHNGDLEFVVYYKELKEKGFTSEEALALLDKIYWTVANEYGD